MLNNFGLLTDTFYKYLTSLSLIASIYCFSYDTLFLFPYNKFIFANDIEMARITIEKGYQQGNSNDLTALIPDSIKKRTIYKDFFYLMETHDTAGINIYYSTLFLDSLTKKRVDSLNIINQKIAQLSAKLMVIAVSNEVEYKNLNMKRWQMGIGLGVSFGLFLVGNFMWYKSERSIRKKSPASPY